ncbi:MAG: hypothetical protein AB8B64_06435 [Granulosicoccus sp.]
MTIRKTAMTMAIPLALLSAVAIAQSDPAAIMEALDTDGSGTLSEIEASASEMIMGNWEALDADENGEISVEELSVIAQ